MQTTQIKINLIHVFSQKQIITNLFFLLIFIKLLTYLWIILHTNIITYQFYSAIRMNEDSICLLDSRPKHLNRLKRNINFCKMSLATVTLTFSNAVLVLWKAWKISSVISVYLYQFCLAGQSSEWFWNRSFDKELQF